MRKILAQKNGERRKFSGIFSRYGTKINYHGHSEETVLFTNVIDFETGQVVADHIWFAYTRGFQKAGLSPGQRVTFEARVKKYAKGYVNRKLKINERRSDYKLSHPTKIAITG